MSCESSSIIAQRFAFIQFGAFIGIITVFSYTLYDITSISNEYDTGVAMVVVDNDENSDDMHTSISSRRNDVVNDDDGVSAPR